MAYNNTSLSARDLPSIGVQARIKHGIVALVAGSATVTVPGVRTVVNAWCMAQSSNAAYVSATSGNTLTLTGTGTDAVAWFAVWE